MDTSLLLSSVIAAFIGVIGTLLAQKAGDKRSDLRYRIEKIRDIVPKDTRVPLEISFRGTVLRDLALIRCHWINRGRVVLQNVPFQWQLSTAGKLLYFQADDEERVRALPDERGEIVLLNPGETGSCEWAVADDAGAEVRVSARGVGVVARPDQVPLSRNQILVTIGAAALGAGLQFIVGVAAFGVLIPITPEVLKWILNPIAIIVVLSPVVGFIYYFDLVATWLRRR